MALRTIRNAKTKFSLILLYGILPNFGQHLANLEHDSFMQLMLDTKPKWYKINNTEGRRRTTLNCKILLAYIIICCSIYAWNEGWTHYTSNQNFFWILFYSVFKISLPVFVKRITIINSPEELHFGDDRLKLCIQKCLPFYRQKKTRYNIHIQENPDLKNDDQMIFHKNAVILEKLIAFHY